MNIATTGILFLCAGYCCAVFVAGDLMVASPAAPLSPVIQDLAAAAFACALAGLFCLSRAGQYLVARLGERRRNGGL